MRKLSTIIAGIIAALAGPPACAEGLTYYAKAQSDQGATFTLTIHRTGQRLRFDIKATASTTSLDGTPVCDSTSVDATGHFKSWCSKFQAQDARVPIEGNLNQLIAQVGPVYRFGTARFKLDAFTPGSFPGR
jgi:hypothetical protein